MSVIVDAVEKIERKLSRENGEFTLFALFERQDIPMRWDLVVAAPWIEQDNEQAMRLLAAEMKKHLPGNQIERISRIILLDSSDASVHAITSEHLVEHGRLEIEEGSHYGLPADRGYLITSRPAA
jgi:predicted sugar kinase